MPKANCPACQKKIINNAYDAFIEEVIGQLRRVQRLHGCWHHLDDGHGHAGRAAGVYQEEGERTLRAHETLKRFSQHLEEEAGRLEASTALFG